MSDNNKVLIFIDNDLHPLGEFEAPIRLDFDTRKLVDGQHTIKIVGKDPTGKEGILSIPFIVRNGPSITVEGLKTNDTVDGVLPLMISSYGKGDQKRFLIDGSETPRSVPSWLWALIVLFFGWAVYYFVSTLSV